MGRLGRHLRTGAVALLSTGFSLFDGASACTTLAVGRKASADGTVMVSHSDDGETNGDPRLCFIPAADHAPNTTRPIYWDTEGYPRFVGYGRGSCYAPTAGQKPFEPIGHIPQVGHTYAYFEATYGILNEHGLGIGESTCSGVLGTNAAGHGGQALLSVDSLTKIAMERASKAREAVALMGKLAEEHGFYGVGSFEGTAESLVVGDPEEVFIFHILPDPTGRSAIWAAQRVPDDHVTVVANMFVIREINFNDPANFLFSESVRTVAEAKGWWKQGEPLDFTKVFSDGEYAHKFYSGRRIWGAYRRFNVTDLPDDYGNLRYEAVYPVTAKAPGSVQVKDLFGIHRDYYQGTKYDMTTGIAAGPWGDPDRWTTNPTVKGNWERSIGLFRTTTTHVVQSRTVGQGSVMWFGPHATVGTVFMPLTMRATQVPEPYTIGDPNKLSRSSMYWAHKYAFNVAKLKYSYAMHDVRSLQDKLETEGQALIAVLDMFGPGVDPALLNKALSQHAENILSACWALPDTIVSRYADGWMQDKDTLSYPEWWLKAVGYEYGPPPPPTSPSFVVAAGRASQRWRPFGTGSAGALTDLMAQGCTDERVELCVHSCARESFAACAASCTEPCLGFVL